MATLYGRGDNFNIGPFVINRDSMQANGLIAWWPGLNNHTFRDFFGVHNGVLSGNTAVIPDADLGFSTFFGGNGTSDIVTVSDDSRLDIASGDFSISFWLRWNNTSDDRPRLINKGDVVDGYAFQLFLSTSKINFAVRRSSITTRIQTNSSILPDVLYHITGTFDGTTTIYVNGLNDNGGVAGATGSSTDLIIGGISGVQRLGGNIADLRFYNRVLSPIEVYQSFAPQTRWSLYRLLHRPILALPPPPAAPEIDTLDLALFDRNFSFTLPARSKAFTLPARDLTLTLPDREE